MSTNNHDKGVFSTIDADDDDDDDLNDYGQFSFENIDKSKQIKRQKTSSNYKHGKQKKITDFFNIFNQDKNVDSNVESSSVIQNDQAKSKHGDHDDDTTLKLFVTTSSSYDICEGKTQHVNIRNKKMELRSGKIASYSRKKNETKSKAPSSKQTVTKPKKDSIPKKPPVKKNVKQKSNPKKTKTNTVHSDDLDHGIVQKDCGRSTAAIRKMTLDVNLGPSIEIENSSLQNVEQMNEPDKCQTICFNEKIDYSRYLFQKNQSERIGQCLLDILQSPSKNSINLKELYQNCCDPFGIVHFISDEFDQNETNMEDLYKCLCKFNQLIEIFSEQARIDQIFITTSNNNDMFINDAGILAEYINLFLNEMIKVNHLKKNLSNNFLAIPFIYILFVQKIAIHNLKNSTPIDLLTIELIDSIPYHFGILLQNSIGESKSQQLQSQLLAILIMGMKEVFDVLDHDLEKFAQLLETILICQLKCMDLLNEFWWPQQNQYNLEQHEMEKYEDNKMNELLLCQLYSLLSMKTIFRIHLKYPELITARTTTLIKQTKIINYDFLFKIGHHFRKLFSQIFHQISSSSNSANLFGNFSITYFIICIIDTLSELMMMMPYDECKRNGHHFHLFWLLFILIKLKNGLLMKPEEAIDFNRIRNDFSQAIKPMENIQWRELPQGSQSYLADFILAYCKNFGIDSFVIDLCKYMINIPKIEMGFKMIVQPLISYQFAK
ncbi:hypothetical protein HUG17_7608 [Dermatophagoides farinae]|uniref:Uncharacterized protein n=1 Tax=Dermatophagoides farinae TaxID=6954 RepID=A0A9D4SCR2_DERFA|nr:hypothetical protein HUG17_7608 [Dermatophagoides farinae]